jgi:hypothetical protein
MLGRIIHSAVGHYRRNPNTQTIPIFSFDKNLPVELIGTGGWTNAYKYDDGTGIPTVILSVRKTGRNVDKTKDLLVKLNEQGYRPHIPIIEKLDQFTRKKKGDDPRLLYRMPLYNVYAINDVIDLLVDAHQKVYLTDDERENAMRWGRDEYPVRSSNYLRQKYIDYIKTFIDPNNPRLEQLPTVIEDLEDLNSLAKNDTSTPYLWDFTYNNLALDNENKVILLDVIANVDVK